MAPGAYGADSQRLRRKWMRENEFRKVFIIGEPGAALPDRPATISAAPGANQGRGHRSGGKNILRRIRPHELARPSPDGYVRLPGAECPPKLASIEGHLHDRK